MGCGSSSPGGISPDSPTTPRQATSESIERARSAASEPSVAAAPPSVAEEEAPQRCVPVLSHAEGMHRICSMSTGQRLLEDARERWDAGDLEAAEKLLRDAYDANAADLGKDAPHTLTSLTNLAAVLHARGLFGDAEDACRAAMDGRVRTLGADHPDSLSSMAVLACLLHAQDKLDEAEEHCRAAMEGRERTLGPEHADTIASVGNMSSLLYAKCKYKAQEKLLRRSLNLHLHSIRADSQTAMSFNSSLAASLHAQGRDEEAAQVVSDKLANCEKVLGDQHPDTCAAREQLAYLRLKSRTAMCDSIKAHKE